MNKEKKFENIKNILLKKFECEVIILFGSYARNTQNEESDIDIAIKSNREISKKEIFEARLELEENIKNDTDLINLDNINDDFRYEILMNGKILYCKDQLKFELYKLDMCQEYFDLNESRQSIIERIKNGGKIYGK